MEQLVGCGPLLVEMNISSLHLQDSVYSSMNANFYKFGLSPPGSASYHDPAYVYEVHNHGLRNEEYRRPPLENSSTSTNEQTSRVNTEWDVNENRTSHDDPVECMFRVLYCSMFPTNSPINMFHTNNPINICLPPLLLDAR